MKMKSHQEVNTQSAFIVKRGKVSQQLKELIKEMRFIMYPNTATKLKVNTLLRKASICRLRIICMPPQFTVLAT